MGRAGNRSRAVSGDRVQAPDGGARRVGQPRRSTARLRALPTAPRRRARHLPVSGDRIDLPRLARGARQRVAPVGSSAAPGRRVCPEEHRGPGAARNRRPGERLGTPRLRRRGGTEEAAAARVRGIRADRRARRGGRGPHLLVRREQPEPCGCGDGQLRWGLDRRRTGFVREGDHGVQPAVPKGQGRVQTCRGEHHDGSSDRRSGRSPAGHGGSPTAWIRQRARAAGSPDTHHVREADDQEELHADLAAAGNLRREAVRPGFQSSEQILALVQRAGLQGGSSGPAENVDAAPCGREAPRRRGCAGVLDRRSRRLDTHRPLRERLLAHLRGGEVPSAGRARDQAGPIRPSSTPWRS